jgi:hypothetical protein
MPEPFIGCPDAPIWLLNLNPGFGGNEYTHDPIVHERQVRALQLFDEPFWMLDHLVAHSGAYAWWNTKLAAPVREVGRESARASFFCVELYGYHSVNGHRGFRVPSQQFGFQLVRRACELGKAFVIMRAQRSWFEAVPALQNMPSGRMTRVRNWRNPTISPGNVESWDVVLSNLVRA